MFGDDGCACAVGEDVNSGGSVVDSVCGAEYGGGKW